MDMDEVKIMQGQLWRVVTDSFYVTGTKSTGNRSIKMNINEIIEIRYPFAWHFRTVDNLYFHAETDNIIKNCKLIGDIWEKIRFQNTASLDEILRLNLYDKTNIL